MLLKICRLGRFAQVFSLLMALHIFNFSIDSRDPKPNSIPEDLSLNDIESITELFAEVVFNFSNAFAEHDEADTADGGTLDFYKLYYTRVVSHLQQPVLSASDIEKNVVDYIADLNSVSLDVTSPPPKA